MITKANQTEPGGPRRLARSVEGRTSGGIAAGLAAFFALEVTHVRLVFVVLALVSGAGLPLCLAVWALIPEEGSGTAHGRWAPSPRYGSLVVSEFHRASSSLFLVTQSDCSSKGSS